MVDHSERIETLQGLPLEPALDILASIMSKWYERHAVLVPGNHKTLEFKNTTQETHTKARTFAVSDTILFRNQTFSHIQVKLFKECGHDEINEFFKLHIKEFEGLIGCTSREERFRM